ncbi:sorbitol dehydrogenase family protein [Pseudooceanicola sp. CBS1P-1]|uniref:Sorbitol dehydrogenase n=1 Tax=Pseudooceanicola albus TaxID=2692189 RepID=A0A6L7G0G2_9RHOB|nr:MULTISPECIES: sugar dehydrogenase complex small subunit [Pseudooceanicola]MBT9383574.1 sorbitol dehydrogenase family protein [Pseudooceanicola endophyticus]MXN17429.1 hypothetical protein [Pseudooceanicola albus]
MSDIPNRPSGTGAHIPAGVPDRPAAARGGFRRRDFLLTSAMTGLAVSLGATPGLAATAGADAEGFGTISAFVTGQATLNPALVQRAFTQLVALDGGFADKLSALQTAIKDSGADSIDAFLATAPAQDLRDTMTTITAVWYLGYTGTPDPSQEKDDAKFVTYRDALMWGPTSDATPIPTYSQHNQNYWAKPPASIAKD